MSFFAAAFAQAGDAVLEGLTAHVAEHPDGGAAFSFPRAAYAKRADLAGLPIGVFDSGIGGLTVLEALLKADVFHNDNLQPGADGRPDFVEERFIYLGDQANMPYGNYPSSGRTDYLRELILKDALFLLGNRYWPKADAPQPSFDKPPVKALVIACNTATAYGLEDVRAAAKEWGVPVFVVGVVEAGARGLLQAPEDGAVGVLATVGTCSSEVYPKTIQRTLGLAGRGIARVTQFGSARLAGVIEGDPAFDTELKVQVAGDVRGLVEAHRAARSGGQVVPLKKVMLGCTHFPLAIGEIDAAFGKLREDPDLAPFIAATRDYINPAEWTARELFRELARARQRRPAGNAAATGDRHRFFMSVPNPADKALPLAESGGLEPSYKYGREVGRLGVEDTRVVPMTRAGLPAVSRRLVEEKLPAVWEHLPAE
ncbi:MAG: aspartate/glutamate racemase family protein [Verrucomicrobiaceae bacterium]|nr:aspartate/glutamate racemase family protein [Verrucomicrobiaceae bacterium]